MGSAYLLLFLFSSLFCSLNAKLILGKCPSVSTKLDFDPVSYLGDWYQQQGNPTLYQPAVSQCIKGTYGANDDGTVSVHNVGQKDPNGPVKEVCGYAETTDVGGVLDLYFPFTHGPNDYEILETDYESYACVWSCTPMLAGVFHREEGYILTREKESRDDLVEKCLKLYKDQGLDNMMDGFVTFYSGDDCKYEVETPDSSCEH